MTMSPSLNMKSTDPRVSSQQHCTTKKMNSSGTSSPMQLMAKLPSTEKQSTQASYVMKKVSKSLHTWKKSQEPIPWKTIRETTSQNINSQQQPLTTGITTNSMMIGTQWMQLKHGNPHATNLLKTPFSLQDGTSPSSIQYTPTNAWQDYKFFFDDSQANQLKRDSFWKKQLKNGKVMFHSWEGTYYFVAAPKQVPFPKCLWLHMYLFIHDKTQPETWGDFFKGTDSFKEWGKTN